MEGWRIKQVLCLLVCLALVIPGILAAAQVHTTDPTFKDSDGDGYPDGPDLLSEWNSKRYVHYGEDKNGNGKYEPKGLDGQLGTADDEFDPNNPSSHPDMPRLQEAPEGLPILKPAMPSLPVPMPNHYYFFVSMDHEQVIELEKRYSYARGLARLELDTQSKIISYTLGFCGLRYGGEKKARVMGPAPRGETSVATHLHELPKGLEKNGEWHYAEGRTETETVQLEQDLLAGLLYIDIITSNYPDGELRGQIDLDRDCDGVSDYEEVHYFQTDPLDRDSDDDGLSDGEEINGFGRVQYNAADGWMDYLRTMEEIEAGISNCEVSDLSASVMRSATVTDPNQWDSDQDGLADGLEIGVTDSVSGFTQDGFVITATQFPDANADGIHDALGYRLIDLAPEEPNTDPLRFDTNGNGFKDGEDDENGNGRIDPGEKDPVKGFYSITGGARNGYIMLGFHADTPYGNGYYMKTEYHFGSSPYNQITIVEPTEDDIHINPRVLDRGSDGKASVEFFIPFGKHIPEALSVMAVGVEPTSPPEPEPTPTPTPLPDPEEMSKTLQVTENPVFANWVSRNLRGNPPTQNLGNYRGDCDDFCKMTIWMFLAEMEGRPGGGIDKTKRKQGPDPYGWGIAGAYWGDMYLYTYDTSNGYSGPGDHWILYEDAVDVQSTHAAKYEEDKSKKQNATTMFWNWKLPDAKNTQGQLVVRGGPLGDPNRRLYWDELIPGDMIFVNYHRPGKYPNDIYGEPHPNREKCDHVFMVAQVDKSQPEDLQIFFAHDSFLWMPKDLNRRALAFDDILGDDGKYGSRANINFGNTEEGAIWMLDDKTDFYIFESHWYPKKTWSGPNWVAHDHKHITWRVNHPHIVTRNMPKGKAGPTELSYNYLNNLDRYFKIESQGVLDIEDMERFVRGVKRFTYMPPPNP